jgi:hypothetical protein
MLRRVYCSDLLEAVDEIEHLIPRDFGILLLEFKGLHNGYVLGDSTGLVGGGMFWCDLNSRQHPIYKVGWMVAVLDVLFFRSCAAIQKLHTRSKLSKSINHTVLQRICTVVRFALSVCSDSDDSKCAYVNISSRRQRLRVKRIAKLQGIYG